MREANPGGKAHPLARWDVRTWCGLALLAAVLPGLGLWAADPSEPEVDERCPIRFKRLADKFKEAGGDREKLRNELLEFRRTFPGTPQALEAAGLLSQLPSALDRLDPATIPALEKYTWQPKELAGVLGEHRGRHGAAVSAVAFSPDGKLIVSGGAALLRVWDPATMRLVQLVYQGNNSSLSFSKDGKMLATGGGNGYVGLYDVVPGNNPLKTRWTTTAGTSTVGGVAFSPDNKHFAVACYDNMVRVYDATAKVAPQPALVQAHANPVHCVAYSPDGKTLASGSADMTVKLWDATLAIPKEKAVLTGHTTGITALAFTPTGTTLAAAGSDGSIRLYTVPAAARGKERVVFGDAKAGTIYCLNFSRTGHTLAAACSDSTVRLWDVSLARPALRPHGKVEGHAGPVSGVMYAPDNLTLVTGSHDWTCRTWDTRGAIAKERFVPWSHISHVYSSAISPDCRTLASGSLDKVLRLWDLDRSEPRTRNYIKGDSIPIYQVAYSPDGSRLAISGNTAMIRQFDSSSGKQLRPCTGMPGYPLSLAYSPDGKYLLAHHGPSIHLYDAATGQEERQFVGHTTNVYSLAFSPSGKLVLSSSGYYLMKDGKIVEIDKVPQYTDCTVRFWETETGKEFRVDKSHKLPVYQAFFAPDGKHYFAGAGGEQNVVRRAVANPNAGETPALPGVTPQHYTFLFSPDGTRILTNNTYRLTLRDVATWKVVWEYQSPEAISHLTFASDSRHLAISFATGVIYIVRLGTPAVK
jgi:WD40 repeat protein